MAALSSSSRGAASGGTRQNSSTLDRPIVLRPRLEVSLSAFAFLFSEIVQYAQARSMSISDIEQQLYTQGTGIGHKLLELQCLREKQGKGEGKRQNRLIGILTFISSDVWKGLFGKAADSLEKSNEDEDEYMIHEAEPVTNQFVSVPQSMGNLNCAAFIAGIIAGILQSADFPCEVSALLTRPDDGGTRDRTVYLIKFSPEVMDREERLEKKG
mmetsp:Transcript_12835/g.34781  ORF Transcript_12835/g.34781 Transcript_12835/m.34781 type:complete len:213 (-) Transcript_12835:101-739(-)|eukprot:CAMPEP_0119501548 /NCGR_PEP_ID=MMETSP1344-20130328/23336_1 /TAXON_ID=236787 /ORGANISM="Florenciella parvula, Strain CCMP2471" /LENGTH=212 /DNA_ID=CAMNT_0007537709 /DNA_START=233 /DNA_END=871 /DNA_ORIENTATION=+